MVGFLKTFVIRIVLLLIAVVTFGYFVLRIGMINTSPYIVVFSVLLLIAEFYTILHSINATYALWPRKYKNYKRINRNKNLQINIMICVCGEPTEIVRRTIIAAKKTVEVFTKKVALRKKPVIAVLNDGKVAKKENWKEIKQLCNELAVLHIARKIPGGFKAGNINNALKKLRTNDPHNTIDIVLDADYATLPKFLTTITKPFVSNEVDFIQTPQRYQNEKTWIAKAANAHQINFFQYYCESKARDNALFLCGTNFAVRREALNAVNGMDTRFITEDYATAIQMHLAGKRGGFIKEPLAKGVAPATLKDYFNQQRRWAKGTFDSTFAFLPQFIWGTMNLKQKLHYLISSTYYLIGLRNFILLLGPIPYLFFNASLIKADDHNLLLFYYLPILGFNFFTSIALVRQPVKSMVLSLITFPVFSSAFIASIFRKKLGFVVTTKKYEQENIFMIYKTQLVIGLILLIGLVFHMVNYPAQGYIAIINYFWASFDIVCLLIGFVLLLRDNYLHRIHVTFSVRELFKRTIHSLNQFIFVAHNL